MDKVRTSICLQGNDTFTRDKDKVEPNYCGEKGLLSSSVRGFLIVVASLAAEHRL